MLVRLFKSNHPLAFFIIPGLSVILRIPVLFHTSFAPSSYDSALFTSAFSWINQYPWLSILTASFFTSVSAIYLNAISDKHGLLARVSFLAGLSYTLIASVLPQYAYFTPVYVSSVLAVFAFDQVLSLHRDGSGLNQTFNAALAVGLAAMFTPAAAYLILFVALGNLYFKTFHPRFISVLFAGALLPWIYWATVKLWHNDLASLDSVFDILFSGWSGFSSERIWMLLLPYILLFALAIKSFMKGVSSNTVRIRKSYFLILWSLVFMLNGIMQYVEVEHAPWMLFSIPLAFILSNTLYYNKRGWLSELLVFSIILWEIAAYWIL